MNLILLYIIAGLSLTTWAWWQTSDGQKAHVSEFVINTLLMVILWPAFVLLFLIFRHVGWPDELQN